MERDALYDAYLDACLSGTAEDPAAFLARHASADEELRARVEALHRVLAERAPGPAPLPFAPESGLPFDRLGEFRLIRPIRRGGMGLVFLAVQESLGRPVALKVIRPELAESPSAAERFRREARTVARLQHPGIVRVHALGEEGGTRYIAMELVQGRGLDEFLEEARGRGLPQRRVARWALEVAEALAYAHREGVVHRDVKPSNVLITRDDHAMLLDFGVARDTLAGERTLTHEFTGSPLYAAPEQLANRAEEIDARTDVYALGATLYECLVGRVPFGGDTVERVFHRILTEEPLPPRRLDPAIARDLEVIALRALEKRPAARYATAVAMGDDLRAFLEDRPIRARPPNPLERLRKWARRRPGRATAVASALIAAIAIVVALGAKERAAAAERRRDARAALDAARDRVERYRERREATKGLEAEVTQLVQGMNAQFTTAEQDRLLEEKEDEVASFRREREAVFYEVLDLLRRAEGLDAALSAGAEEVRAALYHEKLLEARTANDPAAEAFYRELVARHDRAGALPLFERMRVRVLSDPPGAAVLAFPYREQAEVVKGGEHRLVPVPWGGAACPAPPGTWALNVLRGAGAVARDDLVLAVAGHPIEGTVLALSDGEGVCRLDRLLSIDGAPARSIYDVESSPPGPCAVEVERGGARLPARLSSLSAVRWGTPADAAEEGGVLARLFRFGAVFDETLPKGVVVRTTAAPLFLSEGCQVGTTPLEFEAEALDTLLVLRAPGRETVRRVLRVAFDAGATVTVQLPPEGAVPPGFVYVPALNKHPAFFAMEREVTAAEYLEFLNDPATIARIAASSRLILVPRDHDTAKSGGSLLRGDDGRYALPPWWPPDWPITDVSWNDARAYAAWRTERARAQGRSGTFAIPTMDEWTTLSSGGARRMYPWGSRFRPKWTKSCFARRKANLEPAFRFPIDESPYGAYDCAGSMRECVDDWYDEARGLRRFGGGAWGYARPEEFDLFGFGFGPDTVIGTLGIRLVLRP